QPCNVAGRLRHLFAGQLEQSVVHPDPGELASRRLRLRALVLVVRENEIQTAEVDLERWTEELLRHRGTLDVPARPPATPWRVPPGVLALLVRLPEREVAGILFPWVRFLLLDLIGALSGEAAVLREAGDAKVDIAVRLVGVAVSDQLFAQG